MLALYSSSVQWTLISNAIFFTNRGCNFYHWSLLIYWSIWTFDAVLCPGTRSPGAWQALFQLQSAVYGDLCHLRPAVYLQFGFTSEGLTLVGFNSIILLFIFSLSHVLSSHVSFYPWLLCDWVGFWIPFYILCHFIHCNCFLSSFKIHGMHF